MSLKVVNFVLLLLLVYNTNGLDIQPNIIFILADDLGYGDLEPYSIYPAKNSHYKLSTPNLAKMASEGMMFTDAYCGAPVCAPSRCTLMTGMHSGHCDLRLNNHNGLYNGTLTVANILSDFGNYDTAMFGKWGLGNYFNDSDQNDPIHKGFKKYMGQLKQGNCLNYYPPFQYVQNISTVIKENVNASEINCGPPDYLKCNWTGDIWTNNVLNYLSQKERNKNPFFLYLAYTTPHSGGVGNNSEYDIPIPRVTQGPYYNEFINNSSWNRIEIDFATAIWDIDIFVGQILNKLKQQNLDNNTIVFFASDNGADNEGGHKYQFFASSGNLSGWKRCLREGGHRTPLIVRWPNYIKKNIISDYQFAFYDFMQTAADLAGIELNKLPKNDGISMVPTLLGKN
eukprot:181248_1